MACQFRWIHAKQMHTTLQIFIHKHTCTLRCYFCFYKITLNIVFASATIIIHMQIDDSISSVSSTQLPHYKQPILFSPKLTRPTKLRAGGGSIGLVSEWDKDHTAHKCTQSHIEAAGIGELQQFASSAGVRQSGFSCFQPASSLYMKGRMKVKEMIVSGDETLKITPI